MIKQTILEKIGLISKYLSHLGNISLAGMMLLATADVVGRYFFDSPVLGAYEITEYLMIIMVFAFLGLAQSEKAHINVDVVFNHLPPKVQAGLEWFNHLICFLIFALVCWRGIHRTMDMINSGEESLLLKIPDYPFAIFMVLGSIVLTIEFLRDIISLSGAKKEDKA